MKLKIIAIISIVVIISNIQSDKNIYSIPYDYYNLNKDYQGIKGDFLCTQYDEETQIRFMPRFYNGYKNHEAVLEILINVPYNTKFKLKDSIKQLESTKFGDFKKGTMKIEKYTNQQRIRYQLPLDTLALISKDKLISILKGDKIRAHIGSKYYTFIGPKGNI